MTLVFRSSKQHITKPLHDLGPGSYNIKDTNKKQPKNHKQNSSMFLSAIQRDPFQIKKHQKQTKTKSSVQKQNKDQSEQKQTNQEILKNIINQKKSYDCTNVFNSKVIRFNQKNNQKSLCSDKAKQILLAEQFKKILLNKNSKQNEGKILKIKDKMQIKRSLNQKYQFFPSIPNWQNSYGYKHDPQTNKLVSNQNPKVLLMMKDRQKKLNKPNCSLGPGYYFIKNTQISNTSPEKLQSPQSKVLADILIHPNLKHQTPIHNSIQQNQNKMKMRIRLLGKSSSLNAQQYGKQNKSFLVAQMPKIIGKDKKQILINKQIMKKFGQFIPTEQREEAGKYIQKLKQSKIKLQKQKLTKNSKKQTQLNQTQKNQQIQYFLSKSQRFNFKDSVLGANQVSSQVFQDDNTFQQNNSSILKQSHNCKQTLLLGQKRFYQYKQNHQNLGPGTYNIQSINIKSKNINPCLNLHEPRFHSIDIKNQSPCPGDYNTVSNIQKKQNNLGEMYKNYKKHQTQQLKMNFKRQDSMQSLYQNWGRQMNYIAKLQHNQRVKTKQNQSQKNKEQINKSLQKIKKQLALSLSNFDFPSKQNNINSNSAVECSLRKSNSDLKLGLTATIQKDKKTFEINQKYNKKSQMLLRPRTNKHLQTEVMRQQSIVQIQSNKKQNIKTFDNLGPGSYEIRKQMVKKTFNCTYD